MPRGASPRGPSLCSTTPSETTRCCRRRSCGRVRGSTRRTPCSRKHAKDPLFQRFNRSQGNGAWPLVQARLGPERLEELVEDGPKPAAEQHALATRMLAYPSYVVQCFEGLDQVAKGCCALFKAGGRFSFCEMSRAERWCPLGGNAVLAHHEHWQDYTVTEAMKQEWAQARQDDPDPKLASPWPPIDEAKFRKTIEEFNEEQVRQADEREQARQDEGEEWPALHRIVEFDEWLLKHSLEMQEWDRHEKEHWDVPREKRRLARREAGLVDWTEQDETWGKWTKLARDVRATLADLQAPLFVVHRLGYDERA